MCSARMTQHQGQGWCLQLLQHSYHKSKSGKIRNTRTCRLVLPFLQSLAQLILGWVKRRNCLGFREKLAHPERSSLAGTAGVQAQFQAVEIRACTLLGQFCLCFITRKILILQWNQENLSTWKCFCKFKSKTVTSAEIFPLWISDKK